MCISESSVCVCVSLVSFLGEGGGVLRKPITTCEFVVRMSKVMMLFDLCRY